MNFKYCRNSVFSPFLFYGRKFKKTLPTRNVLRVDHVEESERICIGKKGLWSFI